MDRQEGGRRPLVASATSRKMLHSINQNLKRLTTAADNIPGTQSLGWNGAEHHNQEMHGHPLVHHTQQQTNNVESIFRENVNGHDIGFNPGLPSNHAGDKATQSSNKPIDDRGQYNKAAMAAIKNSLEPHHNGLSIPIIKSNWQGLQGERAIGLNEIGMDNGTHKTAFNSHPLYTGDDGMARNINSSNYEGLSHRSASPSSAGPFYAEPVTSRLQLQRQSQPPPLPPRTNRQPSLSQSLPELDIANHPTMNHGSNLLDGTLDGLQRGHVRQLVQKMSVSNSQTNLVSSQHGPPQLPPRDRAMSVQENGPLPIVTKPTRPVSENISVSHQQMAAHLNRLNDSQQTEVRNVAVQQHFIVPHSQNNLPASSLSQVVHGPQLSYPSSTVEQSISIQSYAVFQHNVELGTFQQPPPNLHPPSELPSPGSVHSASSGQVLSRPSSRMSNASSSLSSAYVRTQRQPVPMQVCWNGPIVQQQVKSREVSRPAPQTATIPSAPLTHISGAQPKNYVYMTQIDPQPQHITNAYTNPNQNNLQANAYTSPFDAYSAPPAPQGVYYKPPPDLPPDILGNPQFMQAAFGPAYDVQSSTHAMPTKPNLMMDSFVKNGSHLKPTTVIVSDSAQVQLKPPPPYPGGQTNTQNQPNNQTAWQNIQTLLTMDEISQYDKFSDKSDMGEEGAAPIDGDQIDAASDKCSFTSSTRSSEQDFIPPPRTRAKHFSPEAYKFYMEQHIENVMKSYNERQSRRRQLENEMAKVGLSEEAQNQLRKMLSQKESNYNRLKRAKINSSMFQRIDLLGRGAFGEVRLVKRRGTNKYYAMKTLCKKEVLKKNQVGHVKAERDILAEADNEWVVKLYYSFQDRTNLYFVMDYIPGGDLMNLLIDKEIFDEDLARFYIAELVVAIDSVHHMGFIHRDIKPDNILIDRDGHIKLTDFGLCTGFRWTHSSKYYNNHGTGHFRESSIMVNDKDWSTGDKCDCDHELLKPLERRKRRHKRCMAHSLVGTPNYIAPEVLQQSGYSRCCDWWSVGVILYEMLVGQPPFLADSPYDTQQKVINWKTSLHIPPEAALSRYACSMIESLCREADTRLGVNGASEIMHHGFLKQIEWMNLRSQKAPFVPEIKSITDTKYFDPVGPMKHRQNSSMEDKSYDTLMKNGRCAFSEFTFRRFFDEEGSHPHTLKRFDRVDVDSEDAESVHSVITKEDIEPENSSQGVYV